MNSRQAINLLKGLEQSLDDYCELNDEGKAAFRMAITALELFGNSEQLPSIQPDTTTHDSIPAETGKNDGDGTSGDCISRAQAIDALQNCRKHCIDPFDSYHIDIQDAENQLSKVPTVQPERKKGEWIVHLYKVGVSRYECDACHARCDIIYPYCPYCGEKKEGERDATN